MLFVISLIAAIIEIAVAVNNHPGPGFGGHLVSIKYSFSILQVTSICFGSFNMCVHCFGVQVLGTIVVCIGIFCFPATVKLVLFFASPEQRSKVKLIFETLPVFLAVVDFIIFNPTTIPVPFLPIFSILINLVPNKPMFRLYPTLAQREVTSPAEMVRTFLLSGKTSQGTLQSYISSQLYATLDCGNCT